APGHVRVPRRLQRRRAGRCRARRHRRGQRHDGAGRLARGRGGGAAGRRDQCPVLLGGPARASRCRAVRAAAEGAALAAVVLGTDLPSGDVVRELPGRGRGNRLERGLPALLARRAGRARGGRLHGVLPDHDRRPAGRRPAGHPGWPGPAGPAGGRGGRGGVCRRAGRGPGGAAGGFAAALLVAQVWSALAGFALLGAGLSVVVPLVFSAAAATGRPGPNLALDTSSGYLGVLAGPALIGGVAQLTSLHAALGIVVILCAMCAVLAGFVLPRSAPDPG